MMNRWRQQTKSLLEPTTTDGVKIGNLLPSALFCLSPQLQLTEFAIQVRGFLFLAQRESGGVTGRQASLKGLSPHVARDARDLESE